MKSMIFALAALALTVGSSAAEARHYRSQAQQMDRGCNVTFPCDQPAAQTAAGGNPFAGIRSIHVTMRKVRTHGRAPVARETAFERSQSRRPVSSRSPLLTHVRRAERAARAGLTSIQCGPRQISVAGTAAAQFSGFCGELYAQYRFREVGGWRRGHCWEGGKHPCGGAIDVSQTCRSRGPGHCLPRDFPIALTERLADKYGLQPGSRWASRDCGHFEIKDALVDNGWRAKTEVAAKPVPRLELASADPGETILVHRSGEVPAALDEPGPTLLALMAGLFPFPFWAFGLPYGWPLGNIPLLFPFDPS